MTRGIEYPIDGMDLETAYSLLNHLYDLGGDTKLEIFAAKVMKDSKIVAKQGWTQTLACEKIRDLNRVWQANYIYIDDGYSNFGWEHLRTIGYAAQQDKNGNKADIKLKDIVKINFGSNIETRDPFTNEPLLKYAKDFLVEVAVRYFEEGNIIYPSSDDKLTSQLQQYVIKKITVGNRRTYEAGPAGDHTLDALMLALVSYALEISDIGKPKFDQEPKVVEQSILGKSKEKNKVISLTEALKDPSKITETVDKENSRTSVFNKNSFGATCVIPGAHLNNNRKTSNQYYPGIEADMPRSIKRSTPSSRRSNILKSRAFPTKRGL